MRSVALVARTVIDRKKTDCRISYWKVILLTIPTLGIYNVVTYYRMMKRIKRHLERQHMLYKDMLSYIQEFVNIKGINAEGLTELKYAVSNIEYDEEALSAWVWLVISVMTLGIGSIYPLYRLTVDAYRHDRLEDQVLNKINKVLCSSDILKEPIKKNSHCKKRNFFLYFFLSVLSLGAFSLYWSYVMIEDFNKHFMEHDKWEVELLETLSKF